MESAFGAHKPHDYNIIHFECKSTYIIIIFNYFIVTYFMKFQINGYKGKQVWSLGRIMMSIYTSMLFLFSSSNFYKYRMISLFDNRKSKSFWQTYVRIHGERTSKISRVAGEMDRFQRVHSIVDKSIWKMGAM